MKLCATMVPALFLPVVFLLAGLACSASAQPVHVALKAASTVSPNADGFFTLASVADVTSGEAALRARLACIPIGRAPLSGETRRVTRGDLALKLRQAGCDPEKAAVLEGADAAEVTTSDTVPVGAPLAAPSAPVFPLAQEGAASGAHTKIPAPVIHRGDAVSILIQTGPLTITAPGIARESGGEGQMIRVHREGVMTDLAVQVLDAQTVQLEI